MPALWCRLRAAAPRPASGVVSGACSICHAMVWAFVIVVSVLADLAPATIAPRFHDRKRTEGEFGCGTGEFVDWSIEVAGRSGGD